MVQVKKHSRKTKKGKWVPVMAHFRRAKYRGVLNPNPITKGELKEYKKVISTSFEDWVKENGGIEEIMGEDDTALDDFEYMTEYEHDKVQKHYHNEPLWEDLEEEVQEKKVQDYAYSEFENKYDDWIYKYSAFDFPLTLYREINSDNPKFKGIGIFWSDDKDYAIAHCGKDGRSIVIESKVRPSDVDWEDTLYTNMRWSLGEDEQEIRLKKGRKIFLTKIITSNSEKKLYDNIKAIT